jgi:NADH-quinone oxidoreductase subunit A
MFSDYIIMIEFLLICLIIASLLFIISWIFIYQSWNNEKNSIYECGFNPFSDSRNKFDIKYYIIGILFMIFDLEIIIIIPWLLNIEFNNFFSLISIILFLVYLIIGFYYEIKRGLINV